MSKRPKELDLQRIMALHYSHTICKQLQGVSGLGFDLKTTTDLDGEDHVVGDFCTSRREYMY